MKNSKQAFTLIEVIIVIVIMGIVGKYGLELLMNAYEDYMYGVTNNRLMGESESAVIQIANRLQYRIKESVVYRESNATGTFISTFSSLGTAIDGNSTIRVYEWIGYDNDGWRGDNNSNKPTWSGIIDVDNALASVGVLISPELNTTRYSNTVTALSHGTFNGNGSAIFFVGDESVNVNDGFSWNGVAVNEQTSTNMHPVDIGSNQLTPSVDDFNGVDIYEYYRLAWTAYALEHNVDTGEVKLYYNYRPWLGDNYHQRANGTTPPSAVLMENVQTLRLNSVGDVMKIQLCVGDDDVFQRGAFSVCKEKTIF